MGFPRRGRHGMLATSMLARETTIMVWMKIVPLAEAKAQLSRIIEELSATQERVTVTKNGRPVAVLLTTADLEAIEETIDLLADPVAMKEIERSRQAIADGDSVGRDDLEALRSRLVSDDE